jgi:methionine-rich copper-binding protein CopC
MTWRRRRAAEVAAALLAAVFAVTGGLAGLWATPASAHARLVRAVPGDGATVTTAPARVRLVFDENLRTPAALVVTGPSGTRVEHGPVQVLDNTASVRVDVTAAGRYTVAFRVVSADGHPVSAQTSFRFTPGGSAEPGTAQPGPTHVGHEAAADGGGFSPGRVIGIVAGAGLLAGLALLTVRRLPGGLVNPGSGSGRRDSP